MNHPVRLVPPWPTAPGNNATVILASTHPRQAGGSGALLLPNLVSVETNVVKHDAVTILFLQNDQASAANGLRVFARRSNGTYVEVDVRDDFGNATIGTSKNVQVPVLSAGQEFRATIITAPYVFGFSIEYTAGATGPTAWDGAISADGYRLAVLR